MSEQQTATSKQEELSTACSHPEAVGKRWGDPISEERQEGLQGYLDRWTAETDHGKRKGPFEAATLGDYGVSLTGADVAWLVQRSGRDKDGWTPNLHLEGPS